MPGFVASSTHRGTIEALASSLTGRDVRINGKLSLALLPAPQLVAGRVTITGPDQETIQARSLTLAISLPALLHGQLHATSLTLISPHIDLPWPLPGGSAAIAPPSWLAALHAQIQNGAITLGRLHLADVNATLVTGARQRHHRLRDRPWRKAGRCPSLWRSRAPAPPAPRRCGSTRKAATSPCISSAALNSAGEVTGQLGVTAPM